MKTPKAKKLRKPKDYRDGNLTMRALRIGEVNINMRIPYYYYNAKQCRKLAAWLTRAAQWIEAQKREGK